MRKLVGTLALFWGLAALLGCGTASPGGSGSSGSSGGSSGSSGSSGTTGGRDDPRVGAPYSLFQQLQGQLQQESDGGARAADIAAFFAEVEREGGTPLRDGNDVYFLYEGPSSAAVAGDFNGWQPSTPMVTVLGTDLHVAKQHFNDGERHQYKLVLDGSTWVSDGEDPWVQWDGIDPGSGLGNFNSVVTMSRHPIAETNTRRELFTSAVEANTRSVFVSLPAQYFATRDRLPVLYNHDGQEALTKGQFDQQLAATVSAGTANPLILVSIALDDQTQRGNEYVWDYDPTYSPQVAPSPRGDKYVELVTTELVPFIDANYRTLADAQHRIIAGQSLGGLISGYIAFHRPDVFGLAACQSSSFFWNGNELITDVQSDPVVPVRWYVDSGTGETNSDDNYPVNVDMVNALDARGYAERHVFEQGGTHDWAHWRGRYHDIPETFFPH